MEGLADDVAGEDELCLLRDALVERDIQKPALRPLLSILDQGRRLPSACEGREERMGPSD